MQPDSLKSLLVRSLGNFSDKFGIKHVPLITQNGMSMLDLSYI